MTKRCTRCGQDKEVACFGSNTRSKDGYQVWCRVCRAEYRHDNADKVREQYRRWYVSNKDRVAVSSRAYREANRDSIRAQKKGYYEANRDHALDRMRAYRTKNRSRLREYETSQRHGDTQVRLAVNLRNRINRAINSRWKNGSAVRDLGCSIADLVRHLEGQFTAGMSWGNWGRDGWHIDHVKPLASFDLTDRGQFMEACNWRNLRPIWGQENLAKGARCA